MAVVPLVHPDHNWRFYQADELYEKTNAEIDHLLLVDKALGMPQLECFDPPDLEAMPSADLRHLINAQRNDYREPAPHRPSAQKPAQSVFRRPRVPAPPRIKGMVWHEGKPVHIGWFLNPVSRDEAVLAAKQRRAMGLPIVMPGMRKR